jgi:hypothetical protein
VKLFKGVLAIAPGRIPGPYFLFDISLSSAGSIRLDFARRTARMAPSSRNLSCDYCLGRNQVHRRRGPPILAMRPHFKTGWMRRLADRQYGCRLAARRDASRCVHIGVGQIQSITPR